MARIKAIKTIPEEKLTLRGKSNPNSKMFNWLYLRYDVDAIIICYQNFAAAYSGQSEDEIYRTIISTYYKGK